MAGFGDSNDIQISVTLDTKSAVESVEELKKSIQQTLNLTKSEFLRLAELSKQLNQVALQNIKSKQAVELQALANQDAANKRSHEAKLAQIAASARANQTQIAAVLKASLDANAKEILSQRNASREKIVLARVEASEIKKLSSDISRQAEADAKRSVVLFKEAELSKRQELKKTTAEIQQETVRLRKTRVATSGARSTAGVGKDIQKDVGILAAFNQVLETNAKKLTSAAAGLFLLKNAFGALTGSVTGFLNSTFQLAEASGRLEGLQAGFETLQRSVGRLPTESIERLRTATQGLISDTELYQKANQAVLLQVPTKLFEESAEAAVKLGRAMGIDAAFALESLSIGLGRQSRLYLDNLGIVVSATQAYQNFAAENGKLVSELTETDKRLAFFNETSKKLREGLATLPPIQRTVGSEFTKLSASFENLQAKFLEGFNANRELADTYSNLEKGVNNLSTAFKNFGDVYAGIVALLLNNPLSKFIIGNSVEAINEVSKNLADKFGNSYQKRLTDANKAILEAEMNLADFRKGIGRSVLTEALGYNEEYYQNRLQAAKLTVDNIINEEKRLKAIPPVGIKTDTAELDNFAAEVTSSLESIKEKIGEDLGEIGIRGVDQSQVNTAIDQVASIGVQMELGKIKAQEAQAAIEGVFNSLAQSAKAINIADVEKRIAALNPDDEGYAQALAQLTAEREKYQKTLIVEPKQLERINKVVQEGLKLGKERVQQSKRGAKEIRTEQKELEAFTRGLARALEQAIPADIQQRLIDVFNDPKQSADELRQRVQELGEEFLKSGGDIQAFIKEAGKLDELKKEIGSQPLVGSAEQTEAARRYNEELRRIQEGGFNLRDVLFGEEFDPTTGKKQGGGFLGFDLSGVDIEGEQQLSATLQDTLSSALRLAVEGVSREDAPELGKTIGTAVGAGIGAYFGDPQTGAAIGSVLGEVIGAISMGIGKDKPGTQERKAIDGYFAELFDGGRLGIVIKGQLTGAIDEATGQAVRDNSAQFARISDLVFEGFTALGGNVDFGGEGFRQYFNTLSTDVQASFNGIGLAFGELNGIAIEQSRLIGVALANNIGGSLQNLQVLIQATGESFDDLANAVIQGFLDSKLSIEEAYNALVQLENLYGIGIPGAIGAYQEAIDNLNASLQDNAPGRFAVDSLRDIGAEGAEARRTFEDVIGALGQTFAFTADQQVRLFEALRINGITSLAQLQAASDEQLLAILRNIQLIRENATAPLVTTPQVTFERTPTPRPSAGPRGKSPEDERKDALKKLREETQKLLRESLAYANILERLAAGELSNVQAGAEIVKVQEEIRKLLEQRNKLEEEYEKQLERGRKANKKRLAELAAQLDANKKAIEELTKAGEKGVKKLDISAIIPLIRSANSLSVVSRLVGVDLKKTTDILVQGFLRGKLSLEEFNKQLKATEENLGKGIPNEVGAVTKAFQNLIDAGTRGGQFSVDAFTDIFAEFREKFQKEGSAIREQQGKELLQALEDAKRVAATAVGPEANKLAKTALDAANKALNDFYETIPAPNLSDLRSQLEEVFGVDEIAKFFRAIDESGLRTFEELENAGVEGILPILTRLQELGFRFEDTSDEIKGINQGLNDAANAANGNKDPIQEALNLIKQFNEGANGLPPAFNSTTEAVGGLNDTLGRLGAGFADIVDKLSKLSGQTYENDVVFNIRTSGDAGSKALVDILFGDGSTASTGTGNGNTGGGGGGGTTDTSALVRKRRRLQFLEKNGRGNSDEAKRLRKEIRGLEGR